MTIGNMLYTRLSTERFNTISTEIATLQARISEGTNDPRPSSDPARAANLSAAREQHSRIQTFQSNADVATSRLSLTDEALSAVSARLRQVKDIALQAANSATSASSYAPLRAQLDGLRDALVAIGNSTDAAGQPLFAGLSTKPPFVMEGTTVAYVGDGGHIKVQLSETMRVQTGLTGAEVLMAVRTETGMQSVFSMIDDLATSLDGAVSTATMTTEARLDLNTAKVGAAGMTFSLAGPLGRASVVLGAQDTSPAAIADAINALGAQTGIAATIAADGRGILLATEGEMSVSDFVADDDSGTMATLSATDGSGRVNTLASSRYSSDTLIANISAAIDHVANQQGHAGSLGAQVAQQASRLDDRKLAVDKAISGLNDLDLTAAATRLSALMTQQQAALQTYSMITKRTLFDFMG